MPLTPGDHLVSFQVKWLLGNIIHLYFLNFFWCLNWTSLFVIGTVIHMTRWALDYLYPVTSCIMICWQCSLNVGKWNMKHLLTISNIFFLMKALYDTSFVALFIYWLTCTFIHCMTSQCLLAYRFSNISNEGPYCFQSGVL